MKYIWLDILLASTGQATVSTLLAIVLGIPLAYFLQQFPCKGKRYLVAMLPLLCIMPTKLVAMGIDMIYGLQGISAIIVGHLVLNIPLVVYIVHGAYRTYNSTWDLIAQELGAHTWQSYKDMHLPFLWPTIASATCMIFILCFSSTSLPLLYGTTLHHMTLDVAMYHAYQAGDTSTVFGYGVLRIFIVGFMSLATTSYKSLAGGYVLPQLVHQRNYGLWWLVYGVGVILFVVGPLVAVLHASCSASMVTFLHKVIGGAADPVLGITVRRVILNSFVLAIVSACLAVMVGALLAACSWSRVAAIISLGSLLLGSVACGALFKTHIFLPLFAVVCMCHALLNYPFTYRLIAAHMSSWRCEWDMSAQSFGASVSDRYMTLVLPFMRPALSQAWCIAFGLSLTEVGAGSVIADVHGMTLPMAIKLYRSLGMLDQALGLSVILLLLVFTSTVVVNRFGVTQRG